MINKWFMWFLKKTNNWAKKPMHVIKIQWIVYINFFNDINLSTFEKIGYFFAYNRVIDGVKYICTRAILSLCSHISSSVFKNSFRIL